MDLPTCPSCGQSVLDDDVEDCPFCGASMSGKASRTASQTASPVVRQATSSTATAQTRPVSPQGSTPAPPAAKTADEESDDPFEFERAALADQKVLPLLRQPQPGRRHAVVCPMCESVGYTARKAAGREVRCVNPQCRMPVFTVPPLDAEADDSEASAQGHKRSLKEQLLTPLNIGITCTVAVIGLLSLWYFGGFSGGKGRATNQPSGNGRPVHSDGKTDKTRKTVAKTNGRKPDPKAQAIAKLTKLRRVAMARIERDAAADEQFDITRVLSRRFAAEGYAHIGELSRAEAQWKELQRLTRGKGGEFYEVRPMVAIAWQLIKRGTAGDRQQAAEWLQKARDIVERLPADLGRNAYDAACILAAPLVVLGQTDAALRIISRYNGDNAAGRESLLLQREREFGTFDVDRAVRQHPVWQPASPQRVCVTVLLAARGYWQESYNWALKQPTQADRDDCLAAWAEAHFAPGAPRNTGSGPQHSPEEVAERLPPAYRAALYARIAVHQYNLGEKTEAVKSLERARRLLKELPLPPIPKPPSIKGVFTYTHLSATHQRERKTAAAAAAEVARSELLLDPANTKPAWSALSRAMDFCRTLALSPAEVARLEKTTAGQVGRAFDLKLSSAVALKHRDYLDRVGEFRVRSRRRFEFQTLILENALRWNVPRLLPEIWRGIETWTASAPGAAREPWFSTPLPGLLAVKLRYDGNAALAEAIQKKVRAYQRRHLLDPDDRVQLWGNVHARLKVGDETRAAEFLATRGVDPSWRRLLALQITAHLVQADQFAAAHRFCRALEGDRILQVECFDFLGGLAVRRHRPQAVWETINSTSTPLRPWESAAICHGFVVALQIPEAPRTPQKSAPRSAGP